MTPPLWRFCHLRASRCQSKRTRLIRPPRFQSCHLTTLSPVVMLVSQRKLCHSLTELTCQLAADPEQLN